MSKEHLWERPKCVFCLVFRPAFYAERGTIGNWIRKNYPQRTLNPLRAINNFLEGCSAKCLREGAGVSYSARERSPPAPSPVILDVLLNFALKLNQKRLKPIDLRGSVAGLC